MELLGVWKIKEMLLADENGTRSVERADLEAMARESEDEDLGRLLRSEFVVSETSMNTYYMPLEEEMPLVEEEGWEITERGVLLDSYPARIENGTLMLDYDRNGEEYLPVPQNDEGGLIISDGMVVLQKI